MWFQVVCRCALLPRTNCNMAADSHLHGLDARRLFSSGIIAVSSGSVPCGNYFPGVGHLSLPLWSRYLMPFALVVTLRFSRMSRRAISTFPRMAMRPHSCGPTHYPSGALAVPSGFPPYDRCTPATVNGIPLRSQESKRPLHGTTTVGAHVLSPAVSVLTARVALVSSWVPSYASRENRSCTFTDA